MAFFRIAASGPTSSVEQILLDLADPRNGRQTLTAFHLSIFRYLTELIENVPGASSPPPILTHRGERGGGVKLESNRPETYVFIGQEEFQLDDAQLQILNDFQRFGNGRRGCFFGGGRQRRRFLTGDGLPAERISGFGRFALR